MIPIFKKFQNAIANNPDKLKGNYSDIADSYHWIEKSNFKRLFYFINQEDKEEIFNLFKQKRIVRIEVQDENCIRFKIRPDYDNSLIKDNWEELYVVYYDNCDCVCHTNINQIEVQKKNILKIENNWFKVIAKNKRYIGG